MVLVDAGWMTEVVTRYAEAIGAVTRGNDRAAGNKLADRCIAAFMSTGKAPADCSTDQDR